MDIFDVLNEIRKPWKCYATAFKFTDVQHEDGHFGQSMAFLPSVKLATKG